MGGRCTRASSKHLYAMAVNFFIETEFICSLKLGSTISTTRKTRTGDELFPDDTPGKKVAKRQKSIRRGINSDRLFCQSMWSDDKFSQMLTQLESQPEIGGGSGSGGRGDDEQGDDEDDGEDGEDEDDS
ncbi:hypothetical protein Tco_1513296 [Tanacetum coccineum]